MQALTYILGSTLAISLGAFVGIFTLSLQKERLQKFLLRLVGLSSGVLLGGAAIHLIPEGVAQGKPENFFVLILATIVLYLLIEKVLHWRHCHQGPVCRVHSFGYMNLIGDAIHNFIDGLIIASAYSVNISLGMTTTLAIALHEIPQEIGDFGVLLYAGLPVRKAVFLNFMSALTVVAGGITGWFLLANIQGVTSVLMPLAAGGFLYVSLSDMIPLLRDEKKLANFFRNFSFLLLGIALMFTVKFLH